MFQQLWKRSLEVIVKPPLFFLFINDFFESGASGDELYQCSACKTYEIFWDIKDSAQSQPIIEEIIPCTKISGIKIRYYLKHYYE